jgi:hypothetical protein
MHEQATLLIVELPTHDRQLFFPFASSIQPQTALERFEEDDVPTSFVSI